jgi:signal transduction histidine kinase
MEALESVIKAYHIALVHNWEKKHDDIHLDPRLDQISDVAVATLITRLSERGSHALEKFAVAKYGFLLGEKRQILPFFLELLPQWLKACVEIGAYEECVKFSSMCMKPEIWESLKPNRQSTSILLYRAKSLRNIGLFEDAQICYRQAINLAAHSKDRVEVSRALLLIGKLYGNYLGQHSLFSSFVQDAMIRLKQDWVKLKPNTVDYDRHTRLIAICHDALGQAYRESGPSEVEEHFQDAYSFHESIGQINGISRALCHLHHYKFLNSPSLADKERSLMEFKKGLNMLYKGVWDEKGLGVRHIQLASMLLTLKKPEAYKSLEKGKEYANKYSDFKTLTRAAIIESEFYKTTYPSRAIEILEKGRIIAQKYNLIIPETEINLLLAELSSNHNYSNVKPDELFERNRILFNKLIREVRGRLEELQLNNNLTAEFKHLSKKTKKTFRERLLLDYENTIKQLDLNISALTSTLRVNEHRRRELLVFQIVHSVARSLLHDHGTVIPTGLEKQLNYMRERLENLIARLTNLAQNFIPSQKEYLDLTTVISILSSQTQNLNAIVRETQRLNDRLRQKLRRPMHAELEIPVSLVTSSKRAIDEQVLQFPSTDQILIFEASCDIIVQFNQELIVTVIQNLIQNALEAIENYHLLESRVIIILDSELIGFNERESITRTPYLIVLNETSDQQTAIAIEAAIRNGLEENATKIQDKPRSSGVGLDLARLIFKELMNADISAIRDHRGAGIKIAFKTGNAQMQLVSELGE